MEVATLQHRQSEIFRELQTSEGIELYTDMCSGQPIKEMEKEVVNDSVKEVLQYISFVTGAGISREITIPFLRELKEIITKHYSYLTVAEIKSAFRLNSIGMLDDTVKLYGTSVTLQFIGQVLAKYRIYRNSTLREVVDAASEVDRKLLVQAPVEKKEVTEEDRRQILEMAYKAYRRYPSLVSIAGLDYIYQYMVDFGLIKEGEVREQMGIARAKMKAKTYMEMSALPEKMIGQKKQLQEKYDDANNWKESAYFPEAIGRTVLNKFEQLHKKGAESVFG